MASAPVDICNLALVRVGVKNTIQTLDEDSNEAIVCSILYETQRDVALASWWWSFATGRAALAQIADGERDGWTYAYALPSDLIQARFIYSGSRTPSLGTEIPFSIEANDAGEDSILLTDHAEPVLLYTRRVLNVAKYPPLFVNAMAWLLSAELVLSLPLRPELEAGARSGFDREVARAAAADRNASHEAPQKSKYEMAR